ncbi:O-methyltransferase [Candidatus Poribacteria bacterium]|nr:O-methyltransferase [Candidatus Poribacteria bacterium]
MSPGIFQEPVEGYLARLAVTGLPPVFEEMHAEASRRNFPIVGPEAGRFFFQLARLRSPKRILELGSGFGYSAIWWALGCGGNVHIDCTEFKRSNIEQALAFAEKAGVRACLHYHEGEALASARKLDGPWDIIFCDIDKDSYGEAYAFAKERLRKGDLLLFDNALRHGDVAARERDATAEHIAGVTARAYADADMDLSLVPIRDGVLFAIRQ